MRCINHICIFANHVHDFWCAANALFFSRRKVDCDIALKPPMMRTHLSFLSLPLWHTLSPAFPRILTRRVQFPLDVVFAATKIRVIEEGGGGGGRRKSSRLRWYRHSWIFQGASMLASTSTANKKCIRFQWNSPIYILFSNL